MTNAKKFMSLQELLPCAETYVAARDSRMSTTGMEGTTI